MPEGYILLSGSNGEPLSSEILAVHAALLRDGRVLYFSGSQHDERPASLDAVRIFDPTANSVSVAASPTTQDLFCCGHTLLANGDLFVAGGTALYDIDAPDPHKIPIPFFDSHHFIGLNAVFIFDQTSFTWKQRRQMSEGRWYPSCVLLPDGTVFVISGHGGPQPSHHENTLFEIYDPQTDRWTAPRATNPPIRSHNEAMIYYPRLHLLPNGRLFCSASWEAQDGRRTRMVDPQSGALTALSEVPQGRHADDVYEHANFSSALLPLEPPHYQCRIFICGGRFPRIFDTQARHLGWQVAGGEIQGRRSYDRRVYANAVLLPDGSVLVINGGNSERVPVLGGGRDSEAILFAERFIPDAPYWPVHLRNTWQRLSQTTIARVYHSVALLLPDGRVWIAGSNHDSGRNRAGDSKDHPGMDARELRMEIYSPPYMDSEAMRPQLGAVPSQIEYGHRFVVQTPQSTTIRRVALIRCGSVTHAFDFDQRYVGLRIASQDQDSVTVIGPPDVNIAPPGNYMLFAIDANNIPSVGKIVQLVNLQPLPNTTRVSYVIFERQRGDLDTSVNVAVGDLISVFAEGEIWSGVWLTGNNGPDGWRNPTSDAKFPYHGAPDSFPYSLIGRIGSGPYFWIGAHLDRRRADRAGRLFLRINDDTPNGTGQFRGHIELQRSNGARPVTVDVPRSMVAGRTYVVTVVMYNTGDSTWTSSSAHPYRLGAQNPPDNKIWRPDARVPVPTDISPNRQATFSFSVTAPATPGHYIFQWQMVQEGVEWFGAPTPDVTVTVQELRALVRDHAFRIWLGRVRAGGRYWGNDWSDWFAAKAALGIPPDVHV